MNRKIRQLAVVLMGLYVALFAALNYWAVDRTDELASEPGNTRAVIKEFDTPRGQIVTADGVVVARSTPIDDPESDVAYQREYPTGDLFAQIVGYYTFGLGSTQLERSKSDVLTGDTFTQQVRALGDLLSTENDQSGEIRLTLREDMQQVAKFLLGQRQGSIVLMDVETGALISMWSWPSFDPNRVADPDYDAAFEYVTELQEDERDPLLANAYMQRYMPGSTFKILTTGAGLDSGTITPETTWPYETEWVPPQTDDPIMNYGGTSCGGDLAEVFRRSCNIPFAKIAVDMGPDQYPEYIDRWGVEEDVPIDLPRPAASTLGNTDDLDQRLPILAISGFGQAEVQMVPLHMAMAAGAVANDGEMMSPFVVDAELDHDGRVISRTQPDVWKRPISRQSAEIIQDLMVQVAESGTASCCIALEGGIPVAAKTGTAQLNGPGEPERSHAWITAYAPADDPKYVVAVIIQGTNAEISASTGGRLAGPVAKAMLDEMFRIDPPTPAGAPATEPQP
ncbi:MAG: penicillin-binding transpeptidase domain-containing protein [Ilumatobacter fluminis]|uniref:peptidoglycan D,D-transpeptidase FtsI family protein n=1 Tax=Ilumatobacter fluminis TaxID=467091 RepID=UPI0032EBE59B